MYHFYNKIKAPKMYQEIPLDIFVKAELSYRIHVDAS